MQTLYDFRRCGVDFRPYFTLTKNNGRKALFDSRVIWASKFVLELWDDRRDRDAWRRFAENVEVVQITSIRKDWPLGL